MLGILIVGNTNEQAVKKLDLFYNEMVKSSYSFKYSSKRIDENRLEIREKATIVTTDIHNTSLYFTKKHKYDLMYIPNNITFKHPFITSIFDNICDVKNILPMFNRIAYYDNETLADIVNYKFFESEIEEVKGVEA